MNERTVSVAATVDAGDPPPWKVLIVDDEPSVHQVTRFALAGFEFDGRQLDLLSAMSAADAKDALADNEDTAIILVDVVMETERAGLELVRYIREDLRNDQIRIVSRTGQPGRAPKSEVIHNYDINDYKEKTELTSDRLMTTMYASLRAFRDIVTLKQQGEKLKAAVRDAEAASRAKSAFMATVSHEFRTPLNAILGFTGIMRDEVYGPIGNEKYKGYIWDIQTSGEPLLEMIKDVLEVADGSAGTARLREEDLVLVDIIDDCLEKIGLGGDSGLVATRPDRPSILLRADRHAVQRMLLSLLSNALAHASAEHRIEVSARRMQGGELVLMVRDDGPGFSNLDLDRLTKPFETDGVAEVSDGGGLGVGLAVARRLIELHGGRLRVENAPEGGAVVGLVFPPERVLT